MSTNATDGKFTRRNFLVMMSGAVLGAYALPEWDAAAQILEEDTREEKEYTTRILFQPPIKRFVGNDQFVLVWMEDSDGDIRVMRWRPETEEEITEATRFYRDAHGFSDVPARDTLGPAPVVSPEERKLCDRILDNLGSDEAILDYVRWLKQNGRENQGELIEIYHKLKDPDLPQEEFNRLDDRWSVLAYDHSEEWLGPVMKLGIKPEIFGQLFLPKWFEPRGLTEELAINKPGLIPELADHLFAHFPVLHDLKLTFEDMDLAAIADCRQMNQISRLELQCQNLVVDAEAFFKSTQFKRLRQLHFCGSAIGPDMGTIAAESELVAQLETLDLSMTQIGNEGIEALCDSPRISNLRSLILERDYLGSDGMKSLGTSPHLARLEALNVNYNGIGSEGIEALRGAPFLPGLRELHLLGCGLDGDALKALASFPFEQVRHLDLNSNGGERFESGLEAMVSSDNISTLEVLDLGNCSLSARGAKAIAGAKSLANLTSLTLGTNNIRSRGIMALGSSPHLRKLTHLNVSSNPIGPDGARALAASPILETVTELDLDSADIRDVGANALAKSTRLNNLTRLNVYDSGVTEAGKEALLERFGEDVVKMD